MELPTRFPETPLTRHGVSSLLPDLFRTLTGTWLCGPHRQSPDLTQTDLKPVKKWSETLKCHFDNEYLRKLEEDSGDHGRIVFLQIFEFTLFHLVKTVIVEQQGSGQSAEEGILVAIAKIIASLCSCLLSHCVLL